MALLSSMDIAILTIVHGPVAGCHGEAPNALLNIDLTKPLWPSRPIVQIRWSLRRPTEPDGSVAHFARCPL